MHVSWSSSTPSGTNKPSWPRSTATVLLCGRFRTFVPVGEVSDWIYPFIYSFVRERRKGLELPRVEWTTLYVDRLYQGLFLLVKLPFDRPEAQPRRQLLAIESGLVTHIDRATAQPPCVACPGESQATAERYPSGYTP